MSYRLFDENTHQLLMSSASQGAAAREARGYALKGRTILMKGPAGFQERRYSPEHATERRWWYRVMCSNTTECKNPDGPWMFPDPRSQVCRSCWTPSEKHKDALRRTVSARKKKTLAEA